MANQITNHTKSTTLTPGTKYYLMPFKKSFDNSKKTTPPEIEEVFNEWVTYVKMHHTDNAIIRDTEGCLRLCNPDHLYRPLL